MNNEQVTTNAEASKAFDESPWAKKHTVDSDAASKKFEEVFGPIMREVVDKSIKEISEKVYDATTSMLENDVQFNFACMVKDKVRYIIKGLLEGGWEEATAKSWLWDFDFQEYRQKIYLVNRETIQNKLVEDLLKKIAHLEKEVEYHRRRGEY